MASDQMTPDLITSDLFMDAAVKKALTVIANRGEYCTAGTVKAALTAILPDVIERCAQAAMEPPAAAPADCSWNSGYDTAIETAVFAIRSLSPPTTKEKT